MVQLSTGLLDLQLRRRVDRLAATVARCDERQPEAHRPPCGPWWGHGSRVMVALGGALTSSRCRNSSAAEV